MLTRHNYFIREHVGLLKLSDTYDIIDPENQQLIGFAKEQVPFWAVLLRISIQKTLLPTTISVHQGNNEQSPGPVLFQIKRGLNFGFRTKVEIIDQGGNLVGWFQKKALCFGGAFLVFDAQGTQVAKVTGDWTGWEFRFENLQNKQLGVVSKRWAGIGKELFSTADNYMISLTPTEETSEHNTSLAMLLLAAGLAIDSIFNER